MKNRILTAIIGIPLLLAVIVFSHTVVLPVAVTFFCVLGVLEMLSCQGLNKLPSIYVPSIIYAGFLTFFSKYLAHISGEMSLYFCIFAAVTFAYIFILMCTAVVSKGTKDIAAVSLAALTTVYIVVGFVSLIILRGFENEALRDYGLILFILVFVGAWVPDCAAYFGGRAFGKHKLIPDVSPKKTVEGAVCGILFGPVSFVVTGLIFKLLGYGELNFIALALSGAVAAVVSIFGDLIASLIKRKYGIKDYGKLFPGHGGVMDRFDSTIAIAPFILIICSLGELITRFM